MPSGGAAEAGAWAASCNVDGSSRTARSASGRSDGMARRCYRERAGGIGASRGEAGCAGREGVRGWDYAGEDGAISAGWLKEGEEKRCAEGKGGGVCVWWGGGGDGYV